MLCGTDWADIVALIGSLALIYPALRLDSLKRFLASREKRRSNPAVQPVRDGIKEGLEERASAWQLLDSILLWLGLTCLIASSALNLSC